MNEETRKPDTPDATGSESDQGPEPEPEQEKQPIEEVRSEPAPQETATRPEPAPVRREAEPPAPVAPTPRRTPWFTIIAMVLAIGAAVIALISWQELESLRNQQSVDSRARQETAGTLQDSLAALSRDLQKTESGRVNLDSASRNNAQKIIELSQKLARTENIVDSLQGVSDATRRSWIVAEVEYYLRSANHRLQMARDIATALATLRMADARLAELDDPGVNPVRAELKNEILALEGVQEPDISGLALSLGGMQAQVSSLPLRRQLAPEERGADAHQDGEDASSGWGRAVNAVGTALKGVVNVRRSDEAVTPLLAPREEFFLYANLELKLEAARLALLRGDETLFRESLRTARLWLDAYFDLSSSRVASMLATIKTLEASDIAPVLPDISGSLRELLALPAAGASR